MHAPPPGTARATTVHHSSPTTTNRQPCDQRQFSASPIRKVTPTPGGSHCALSRSTFPRSAARAARSLRTARGGAANAAPVPAGIAASQAADGRRAAVGAVLAWRREGGETGLGGRSEEHTSEL